MLRHMYFQNKSDFFIEIITILFRLLLFLSKDSIQDDDHCDILLGDSDHQQSKTSISKWWHRQNVTKPLGCRYQPTLHYNQSKFVHMLVPPEIKSFPCTKGLTSPRFYFEGKTKNGYLEGKGKLVLISEHDWAKLTYSDVDRKKTMAMKKSNVCIKCSDLQARNAKEITGTFRRGSIQGLVRILYTDNSLFIGHYKNGKAHGYGRLFNQYSQIVDAGGYEIGWD